MVEDLRVLIERKRDGGELDGAAVERFVAAAARGTAPDVQLAAMLMAIFCRGLSTTERTAYALAMMRSGTILSWDGLSAPTVDKHSTGGVGDKVSLVWAPLLAACGYAVPMISGRGLGHTGGTLDKLESIPGYRTDLDGAEMRRVLDRAGCVITGQTADLVPADRSLYDLRSRTATVPTLDHIAPSIMSKKLAEGARTLVLDVKVGSGAFMKTEADARQLAEVMIAIGRGAGRRVAALLSSMDSPLGRTAGNALEVKESVEVLEGGGPSDLIEITMELAVAAIRASEDGHGAGGAAGPDDAVAVRSRLQDALDSGRALQRFLQMVEAQGGDPRVAEDPRRLLGSAEVEILPLAAPRDAVVAGIDALDCGLAVAALGGGRGADGSAPHPGVGIVLRCKPGERAEGGAPWVDVVHRRGDARGLAEARRHLERALRLAEPGEHPAPPPLVRDRLGDGVP